MTDVSDFELRGGRLWENLLDRDDDLNNEANPAREVAISACYTADRVDRLERLCVTADPVIIGPSGTLMTNPLFVEVRNQATMLARLIAALRLPDVASGKKPEHRQMRGNYQTSGGGALSALERARNKAAS